MGIELHEFYPRHFIRKYSGVDRAVVVIMIKTEVQIFSMVNLWINNDFSVLIVHFI
jgi:hypothetical protein